MVEKGKLSRLNNTNVISRSTDKVEFVFRHDAIA